MSTTRRMQGLSSAAALTLNNDIAAVDAPWPGVAARRSRPSAFQSRLSSCTGLHVLDKSWQRRGFPSIGQSKAASGKPHRWLLARLGWNAEPKDPVLRAARNQLPQQSLKIVQTSHNMDVFAVAPAASGAARRLLGSEEPSIFQSRNGRMAPAGVALIVVVAVLAPVLLFALGLALVKRLKRRRQQPMTLPGTEEPTLPKLEPASRMDKSGPFGSGSKGKQSFLGALPWSSSSSSAGSDKNTIPAASSHLDGDVPGLKIIRANSSRSLTNASMVGSSRHSPDSSSLSRSSHDSMATATSTSTTSAPGPEQA